MKTTLEIPDELYRAVKAKAALEGRRVTDVVIQGLRLLTEKPRVAVRRVEFPIIKTSKRKDVATLEQFQKAETELYEDEVKRFAQLMRR
jgi:hypothetical protein